MYYTIYGSLLVLDCLELKKKIKTPFWELLFTLSILILLVFRDHQLYKVD